MKKYLNPNKLLKRLKSKGLTIEDEKHVLKILNNVNYFFLKGYFSPFVKVNNLGETKFKDNVDMHKIYALYSFDKNIKMLFLRAILDVEQKIKTVMNDVISSRYGMKENLYLNPSNFDQSSPYLNQNLKKIKKQIKSNGEKHSAYNHYKKTSGHIPFWVLSKFLTLGATFELFSIMKPGDKGYIAKKLLPKYKGKKIVSRLTNIFSLIIHIRNVCAHDDILFNAQFRGVNINPQTLIKGFNFQSYSNKIIGSNDIFGLLISLKHLMSAKTYNKLLKAFSNELKNVVIKTGLSNKTLLEIMGIPINFLDLITKRI